MFFRLKKFLLVLAAFFAADAAAGAQMKRPIIDRVTLEAKDVFDTKQPGQDTWVFRLANKIHVKTKEAVIRREILLEPGDAWDPLLGIESERNLRQLPFLKNARLKLTPTIPGHANLNVTTQDTWTLSIYAGFGTLGGEPSVDFGVEERNLFGYGKDMTLYHESTAGREFNEIRYVDPRLLGSRINLTALGASRENGNEEQLLVERPYYSLTTPGAFNVGGGHLRREAILYQSSEQFTQFIQRHSFTQVGAGMKVAGGPDFPQRADVSYMFQDDAFEAEGVTLPGTLPTGRTLSGLELGYGWVQGRYVTSTFINKTERVEDFNVGNEGHVAAGPFPKALGSDRNRWLVQADESQGFGFGEGRLLLFGSGLRARLTGDGPPENALLHGNMNLYWKLRLDFPFTWAFHAETALGKNLDGENQLLLGGDNGLRGYHARSFAGNKAAMANLEARVYSPDEALSLMNPGVALFADAGTAASPGQSLVTQQWFSDVGAGLRFGLTRSSFGTTARIDLAYALRRGPGGGSRWVLSIATGHAFGTSTNAAQRFLQGPMTVIKNEDELVTKQNFF